MPRSNSRHRRGESPSPNRHGSNRHRRSQERRHSPSPRRKSTERPLQSRRSSSQDRSGIYDKTKKVKPFIATVNELIQTRRGPHGRTEERTKTPSSSPSRSRSPSRSPSKKERRKSPRARSSHSRKERSKSPRANSSSSKKERKKSPRTSSSHSRKDRRNYQQTMLTLLLPDEQIWEENGIDIKSLRLNAAEELSKLPKVGEIYSEVEANVKNIFKRLKHLSEKLQMLSINEANEIADATILLRFLRKSNNEIQLAGQMAHKGALLMLQAEVLSKKGKELLEQSKNKLKSTMS